MRQLQIVSAFIAGGLIAPGLVQGAYAQASSAAAAPAPLSATQMLQNAEAKAAKEHKNVFLIFHASWCGWCHRLDALMDSPKIKPFFDKNYIVVHIDGMEMGDKKSEENAGWAAMMKKYGADNQGIPFWIVFNPKGKVLLDCKSPNDLDSKGKPSNMGFPDKQNMKDVDLFIQDLKKTSAHMPDTFESDLKAYITGLDY